MGSGLGHTSDMNKRLCDNKELLKRSSYFGNSKPTQKTLPKIPNKTKQQIRRENKRSDIIRAVVTIILFALIGLIAVFMFAGY
ncbi:MAG: hypothetical protein FWC94_01645 [Bacteroidales bacterium]|nr:hypothetical protein [Bacteroidales bacterium]